MLSRAVVLLMVLGCCLVVVGPITGLVQHSYGLAVLLGGCGFAALCFGQAAKALGRVQR